MINPEGEKALARAAKSTGVLEIVKGPIPPNPAVAHLVSQLSTSASHPLDQILQEAPDYPFLFQLYVNKDRKKSEESIKKATELGFRAIFVTVDAAGRGKRESDERLKVDEVVINPITGQRAETDKKGGGLTRIMGSYIDQALTWEDLKWIRSLTHLPIVLKGVTNAEDAKIAMDHKVDGILLSNHGGRNLDYSPPAILLLLEMYVYRWAKGPNV
jgi:L-lactate dehydrogenase (cytochrome)